MKVEYPIAIMLTIFFLVVGGIVEAACFSSAYALLKLAVLAYRKYYSYKIVLQYCVKENL